MLAPTDIISYFPLSTFLGSILVLDKSQHLPNRMWCQFEIWQVLKHHDVTKLLVGLPGKQLQWDARRYIDESRDVEVMA